VKTDTEHISAVFLVGSFYENRDETTKGLLYKTQT